MPLHSTIDPKSPEFARNADVMRGLVAELRDKLKVVSGGGGETSRKRHTSRGKMLARERVDLLVDPGTAFLELSPLAANGLYDDAIQLLGGNGYINDYPTGRLLRDAKLYEIGAGTSEIRRMLIGRELFEKTA